MSIFRNTFTQEVSGSLNARQQSLTRRNPSDIVYQNSRNAWIRMTSGVDVNDDKGALAKQYIMLGGVLNEATYKLRYGVGDQFSAYSNTSPSGNSYNTNAKAGTAGIKPMPGITSIDVKSKTAYGSLRDVTVNFSCNNLQQLEDLELLYMRPGYTVLVEWGWTPYLDNKGNIQNNIEFYDGVLEGNRTREQIFKDLFDRSGEHHGNYEAHYGYVKNYSWTARADGGFDCITTIISVGEIMESLNANWIPLNVADVAKNGLLVPNKVETNYIASRPTSTFLGNPDNFLTLNFNTDLRAQAYSQNILAGLFYELYKHCKANPTNTGASALPYDLYTYIYPTPPAPLSLIEGGLQAYITLNSLTDLINKYVTTAFSDKEFKNVKPFTELSTKPNNYDPANAKDPLDSLLCLAHPLQVSVDPSICLITSPIWAGGITFTGVSGSSSTNTLPPIPELNALQKYKDFRYKGSYLNELGNIGNIYVNVNRLYQLALDSRLQTANQELKLYDYLKTILKEIQESIGGVNNFEIHIDPTDCVARIIDLNYVDDKSRSLRYEEAFQIEMSNLNSVVRQYSLQSAIFPNQANLIALGSQVGGGGNQASQNSTLLDFNVGIEDRIMPKKLSAVTGFEQKTNLISNSIKSSLSISIEKIGVCFVPNNSGVPAVAALVDSSQVSPTLEYKSALANMIRYFQGITNSNTKNRAIIPVKVSLTMDGIGGLIIGHLFKIPPSLLPKGYRSETVGAKMLQIVMGISHKIENGDWITTIEALNTPATEPSGELQFNDLIQMGKNGFIINLPKSESDISNSYPNKAKFDYVQTKVTRQEVVDYLKYRTDFDINVRRSVLAIFQIESRNGASGINNNYYGIQTDVGKWTYGDQYFSGTTIVNEGATNNLRRFATFADYKTATYFMLATIKSRNIIGNTGDKWAESYVFNWLSPPDKATTYQNRRAELASIYNNAVKDLPN